MSRIFRLYVRNFTSLYKRDVLNQFVVLILSTRVFHAFFNFYFVLHLFIISIDNYQLVISMSIVVTN